MMMSTLVEESLDLRARYDEEPSHSDHVCALALEIFDGLRGWHGFGARPRELLRAAAVLHDIGWSQTPDGKGHHKWSARLIQDHAWKNLQKDEVAIVSQTARYHRKAPPCAEHAEFQALPLPGQKTVMILGGILRLADALDRTHTGRVKQADASISADTILVKVQPIGSWNAERTMFETKKDMLQLAAGRSVFCEEL